MTFDGIIEALGGRFGAALENVGGAAAVEIDGAVVVLQDAGELLLLRAEIGELPDEGRDALVATAMRANFLYQGTGGSTLALDPDSGRLVIQKYNWLERLDPESAFDMLVRFAGTVNAWRGIVADYRPATSSPDASGTPLSGIDSFMQV